MAPFLLFSLSMLAHVYAAALTGIEAGLIKVEVDVLSQGLPGWSMVGLLETAVREAKDRVGSAIRNAGYAIPNRKTIINLSPADIKKGGAHYDLPIAVGLLTAVGVCRPSAGRRHLIAGELSLTGQVLPVNGALLMAQAAREHRLDGVILPAANAEEAALSGIGGIVPVETLAQAVAFLNEGIVPPVRGRDRPLLPSTLALDYAEVRGQPLAKRGMEIAAAGGHHVALKGPPGTGKSMLAERLPTILPPLGPEEALDVARIQSWHGLLKDSAGLPTERPFRAPHHSASSVGLIGGGMNGQARLGEVSLAHRGVLFLDELAEFRHDAIEVLRQPLESGWVRIVRAGVSIAYPARFQLVAAFNPCRCGFFGHPTRPCLCSIVQIRSYRTKLSGPLLDRIDLHVEVGPPPHEAIIDEAPEEPSAAIRARVLAARERQAARYGAAGRCNGLLTGREVTLHCRIEKRERAFLHSAASRMALSARAIHRIQKVARTIADLAGCESITAEHLAEAIGLRPALDDVG